jgi:hypothetical protein
MKKCTKCKEEKDFTQFCRNKSDKSGFHPYCKDCNKKLAKTKYKDVIKLNAKKYYLNNKDNLIKHINYNIKTRDEGLSFIFNAMRRRCKYPSQKSYKYYGGKGIIVEWNKYLDFKNDMYGSYLEHISIYGKRETTIDRIDSDKNYCKENCRWATYKQQAESKKLKLSTV